MSTERRLYRSRTDRVLWGVCGGLAQHFGIDPILVRIIFVLLAFANGFGILAYIVLTIIIPLEGTRTTTTRESMRENVEEMKTSATDFGKEVRSSLTDEKEERTVEHRRGYLIGVILIVVGVLFLMGTFNLFWWLNWHYLWPLILVAIGLLIIFGRRRR